MNSKIKTYLSIPLLFLIVALLWSIAGNALFDLPKLEKDKKEKENILSLVNIIYTNNFDNSIEFYNDVVGFKLISKVKDSSGIHSAMLNLGAYDLQIRSLKNDSLDNTDQHNEFRKKKIRLLFEVRDTESFYEKVKGSGIIHKDYYKSIDGSLAFDVNDPDGNIISFQKRKVFK